MRTADKKTIDIVLASAKKQPLKTNAIVIARYKWLLRHGIPVPSDMELPNLYLKIKNGKLTTSNYKNVLVHEIKKQNYHIQILN